MTPHDWILSGDTGTSSKTIWAVMMQSKIDRPDIPYDPADFGRCYRLLAAIPAWRARLNEVSTRFKAWKPFIERWDELTAMYEREIQNESGKAPDLYARMLEIREVHR
jgi:hypothetical protein